MFQGPEGDKNAKMAMENPERFVVKPQREAEVVVLAVIPPITRL